MQIYKNITIFTNKFQLMIDIDKIKSIGKIESAYDPNIPFSMFDKCITSGIEFNGERFESKRFDRTLSTNFSIIWKFLEKFGYKVDDSYVRYKGAIAIACDYKFISKGFPYIIINFNHFHHNLFRIQVEYDPESRFHSIEEYEVKIIEQIDYWAKRKNDLKVIRDIKLMSILN